MPKLVSLTYLKPRQVPCDNSYNGTRVIFCFEQIEVNPNAIRWLIRNTNPKIPVKPSPTLPLVASLPPTRGYIEGLGKVYLKQTRKEIKALIAKT